MNATRSQLLPILLILILVGCTPATDALPQATTPLDTGVDPDAWVLVPEGDFFVGLHAHETPLEYAYEIMVTDVTNEQFARFDPQHDSQV